MADVLIVEDVDMQAALLIEFLNEHHAIVGRAVNKQEAIQLTRDTAPDVVLMDLNLEQGNGFEATDAITSMQESPSVIISTVHVRDELKERAIDAGADEYIIKPYSREELLDVIEHVLQGSSRPGGVLENRNKNGVEPSSLLEPPPQIDFSDVGGMTELKQKFIDKIIEPLERRPLFEEYGLGVVNAVLLYGPPGTGKTYISKALAGELDYNFIEAKPDEITSAFVGEAASNVAELFETARENQPCLVFIDELEGIASNRSGGAKKTQSERQMINQLLTEMSETKGEDVILVGATNLPKEVDDAAWDRFEERIEVPLPDGEARAAILRIHLREPPVVPDEIDWDRIKEQTNGYSARDLESVAREAAHIALQEAVDQDKLQAISQTHLEQAIANNESNSSDPPNDD